MSIKKKILDLIEEKAIKDGIYFPSNESVVVELEVTEVEFNEFYNDDELSSNDKLSWSYDDGFLCIRYKDNEN